MGGTRTPKTLKSMSRRFTNEAHWASGGYDGVAPIDVAGSIDHCHSIYRYNETRQSLQQIASYNRKAASALRSQYQFEWSFRKVGLRCRGSICRR